MKKISLKWIISAAVAVVLIITCTATFLIVSKKKPDNPGGGNKKDAIVIMTEELNGLYNPFYATAGTDMDVVGMTQIGMLSTDRNGNPVAGDNEATVTKAYSITKDANGDSVYTFVLKNGLKFSDGVPLTINDVMFNMYEYLDPVYSGSSTMYSTKIKGLKTYRTQENLSDESADTESQIYSQAAGYAKVRIQELINVFKNKGKIDGSQNSFQLDEAGMKEAIGNWGVSRGYQTAVGSGKTLAEYREKLKEDYELTLTTFKKELQSQTLHFRL